MENEEEVFKNIQRLLKNPPIIIWGSGATIPHGYPSMNDLNNEIREKIPTFNQENDDLEKALNNSRYNSNIKEIKAIVWDLISQKDKDFSLKMIGNSNNSIISLISWIRETHPRIVNIITTNYDRALEYTLSYNNLPFTDGFSGREFSHFNIDNFKKKNIINLIKVHGSINWFDIDGVARYRYVDSDFEPLIILPAQRKYQEAFNSPFRELIQQSDKLIEEHDTFLVIGFGFNDEHITPKVIQKIKQGAPLVLITRKVTSTCKSQLNNANNIILIEHESSGRSHVYVKINGDNIFNDIISGEYWQLENFMRIVKSGA